MSNQSSQANLNGIINALNRGDSEHAAALIRDMIKDERKQLRDLLRTVSATITYAERTNVQPEQLSLLEVEP